MAHFGSKGFYVKALKEAGISKHPTSMENLKKYKTSELFGLYKKYVLKED